jgi:large exoprotein involved in heme utilization and adhesion
MDEGSIQAIAEPDSHGDAGNIEVRVGRLTLTGGAQISSSTISTGRGGDLTVEATESITIAGEDSEGVPSGLFSGALSLGDGGRLVVSAPTLHMEGGQIASSTVGGGQCGQH